MNKLYIYSPYERQSKLNIGDKNNYSPYGEWSILNIGNEIFTVQQKTNTYDRHISSKRNTL